jgi:hypothetical protein
MRQRVGLSCVSHFSREIKNLRSRSVGVLACLSADQHPQPLHKATLEKPPLVLLMGPEAAAGWGRKRVPQHKLKSSINLIW